MEVWSDGEERCSCVEPILRHIPKLERLLGALLCLEEGKAMQGDDMFVQSPHSHHLVWRERAVLGSPFMLFPRVGSSRPLVDSASCPQHGIGSALFHCGPVLGTVQDSAWLAHVSW